MSAAVGADVESICSKCGDVWHVVVAKVGDKIAKVQCKECGGYHRFRPPGGRAKEATVRRRNAPAARTTAAKVATRIDKPAVEPDLSRPARPYRISESYEAGDRIEHPKFGLGVVEGSPGVGKMDVFFADGRRVLAQAKPGARLEPPARRTFEEGPE